MLRDVNDSREQARLLAEFLKPLHAVTRCRTNPQRKRTGLLVNLIPFNEGGGGTGGGGRGARDEAEDGPWAFKRPPSERVQEFQAELRRRGVWASVRVQRGRRPATRRSHRGLERSHRHYLAAPVGHGEGACGTHESLKRSCGAAQLAVHVWLRSSSYSRLRQR